MKSAVWMTRYWVSSWLLSAALWTCPGPNYAAELKRRVYKLKAEAIRQGLERAYPLKSETPTVAGQVGTYTGADGKPHPIINLKG